MTLYVYRIDGRFLAAFDRQDRAELWAFANLVLVAGEITFYRIDTVTDEVTIPEWQKP
jgi:hypothetical protein